jgi:ketosteroid isomerase-like protein
MRGLENVADAASWGMSADLIALVELMDRCWMERRFEDLAAYIADDVVMVAPGGQVRMEGLRAAIESYREFMGRSHVRHFAASDHVVTVRGDAAVVEYKWVMAWESDGATHDAAGGEILVLARRGGAWRVIWRTQRPA